MTSDAPAPSLAESDHELLIRALAYAAEVFRADAATAAARKACAAAAGDPDQEWDEEQARAARIASVVERHIAGLSAALARFKAYVHQRLDDAGVPIDPDSPHKAAGCRIGGRLDWLLDQLSAAREIIAEFSIEAHELALAPVICAPDDPPAIVLRKVVGAARAEIAASDKLHAARAQAERAVEAVEAVEAVRDYFDAVDDGNEDSAPRPRATATIAP